MISPGTFRNKSQQTDQLLTPVLAATPPFSQQAPLMMRRTLRTTTTTPRAASDPGLQVWAVEPTLASSTVAAEQLYLYWGDQPMQVKVSKDQ